MLVDSNDYTAFVRIDDLRRRGLGLVFALQTLYLRHKGIELLAAFLTHELIRSAIRSGIKNSGYAL